MTAMIPQPTIAPLLLFIIPNKLSIALWGAASLISVFLVLPGLLLCRKLGWVQIIHAIAFGLLIGLAIPILFYIIFPLLTHGQLPVLGYHQVQLFGYCIYIGLVLSIVYWFIAIRGNVWLVRTR